MNRCISWSSVRLLALTSALGLINLYASAQGPVREFPKTALRGVLQVTSPPLVLLNGQAARLSPGARIRNSNNLIVLSATLVGQELLVNYIPDTQGMLHDVWILRPAEAQQKHPGLEANGNVRFGSEATVAPTDQ